MTDEIAKWLTSPAGRWARIGVGIGFIAGGAAARKPLVAALGLLLLIGGVFDVLLISPLLAVPTTGRKVRREIGVLQDAQLCSAPLSPRHEHLADPARRELKCA